MERQQLFNLIRVYLQRNGIQKAAVFGSYARGQEQANSDIDLLLELGKATLFDVLRFEAELGVLTQRRIDIVEYRAVKPALQKSIFSTTIPLL